MAENAGGQPSSKPPARAADALASRYRDETQASPFVGGPDVWAAGMVHAIDRRAPLCYSPSIGAWLVLANRRLPRFVTRCSWFWNISMEEVPIANSA